MLSEHYQTPCWGAGDKDIQQIKGKMHNTAFTWQGISHAFLHHKSFITQLQVAGSVPREYLGAWSLHAQQTPTFLGSQAAAGASSPSTLQSKVHQRATRPMD